MSSDNQPAFRVYAVIPREGKDDYWLNIGLAFGAADTGGRACQDQLARWQ